MQLDGSSMIIINQIGVTRMGTLSASNYYFEQKLYHNDKDMMNDLRL